MSCRRVRRELLWLTRFGELGPSSQPHLDHLAGCRGCRDDVGVDREMVRQLRVALAARVEGLQPPASAWETILRRAQAPEPARIAWWQRPIGLVGRLRTATAIASTGLALVLALNMEVVPVSRSAPVDATVESPDLSMLEDPQPFAALVATSDQRRTVTVGRPHPEVLLTLPPPRGATWGEAEEQEPDGPPGEYVVLEFRFDRPAPADDATIGQVVVAEPATAPTTPVPSEPGQPS